MNEPRLLRRYERAMWRLARRLVPDDPWTRHSAYKLGGDSAVVTQEDSTS